MLSADLEARLKSELQSGERVVWAGQPRIDLAVRPAWFLVPFGIVFIGFALLFMAVAGGMAWLANAFLFGPGGLIGLLACCGIPFLAVGLLMVRSSAWLKRQAGNTLYALTDRRAIVFEPGWGGAVTVRNSVWRTCWQQGRSALDFLSQLLRGTPVALALPP
jgi:hypothetical protein